MPTPTAADQDLEGLIADARACEICQGLPLGPRPIFQVHRDAKILIAGQAPGSRTHEKGIPFDDPSGVRLRDWLGIDQETFYDDTKIAILPMGFCFPGTGKGGDLPPRPECAPAWRQPLLDGLTGLDLTLIIGRYALDWHLPDLKGNRLTDAVADWRAYWPEKLLLPHPSPRNNRWLKQNPWFEVDVIPALQERVSQLLA